MKIIDSHCHLDDFYHDGTIDDILRRADIAFVDKMIAVGTHYDDWKFYSEFVKSSGNIFYTVGLHPMYSEKARDTKKMQQFLSAEIKPVAVGEIGLDYHRLPEGKEEDEISFQKKIFLEQLKFAKENNLPVVVHSRKAFDDTFNILAGSKIRPSDIVFHCYDYGVQEMHQLKEFGCYVSFSGMLTFKKGLIAPLEIANIDKLLIETDCPYLSPVPYRAKQNEPAFIRATAEFAANILKMHVNDFCNLTYRNTERFFRL